MRDSGQGGDAPPLVCTPRVVAAGITEPSLIAVNDAAVYWNEGPTLRSIAHGASTPVTLLTAAGAPIDLKVDATHLYWTDSSGLHRLALASPIDQTLSVGSCLTKLALDASSVYWANQCANTIERAAKDGTAPSTLATNVAGVNNLATDATAAYATSGTQGTIIRISLPDGVASTFASNQNGPQSVTTDATSVFWSSGAQLMRAPKSGGAPNAIASETVQGLYLHIASIAADQTGVYWLYADAVRVESPVGSPPITLASGQAHPQNLQLHSSGIYWANNNGGSIVMCPR